MASGARFTATFDLRFAAKGEAGYLATLRKTETAQQKVARATKLAAGVGATAAKATQTQAAAAKAATLSTDALASAQAKQTLATKAAAAAASAQATDLFRQAGAIKVVDDATAKLRRETLQAAKASSAAAVALGAQDKAMTKAATSATVMARSGRDADRAFMGAAGRVGDFAKRAAGLTVLVGAAGLGLAFKSSLGAAADFDTALREVGAVSDTSGAKLQALGKISRQAGLETGVGAKAATQAMGELAKAGVEAADIGPALKGTLQLAQAGGLDAASAAEAAANAMSAFGLEGSKATKVADAYANAANMTTADVGDFALAMSQGSSAAKTAGLSFEDTTLALTLLARNAVKGSDAGTSLKAAITQLASPTKASLGVMEQYGLSFFDAAGNMKSISDISGMLNTKLGKLTREQRLQALTTLAGTDGQRALGAMMGVTTRQADKLKDSLTKQGSAAKTAQAKQGGYAGAMARLKASFEEVKIAVGTPLLGALSKAADAVSKLVNRMSKAGTFGKIGRGVGDFIAGIGGKTPKATTRIVSNGGMKRTEAVAAAPQSGAMKAGATVAKVVSGAAKAAGDAFAKLRPQLSGFIKDVGPAWQNIIKPFLQGFGQGLLATAKVVVTVGVGAFRVLGKVLGALGTVAGKLGLDKVFRALGTVVSWFAGGPIAKALGAAIKGTKTFGRLSSVVRAVATPFRAAGSAAMKVGSTLLRVAGWVADKATLPYRTLGRVVFGMGKTVAGAVVSAAAAVGRFASRVGSAIGKAIDWFKRLPGRALDAVKGLGSKLGGMVGSIAAGAGKIGKGIVDGIINAIKSGPGAIASAIGNVAGDAWDRAKGGGVPFVPGLRGGGKVRGYFGGGEVTPVNLASGELLAFPGGGQAMVPGGVSAYDNVQTAVPVGTRVFTTHGQDLMASGMSASMALAQQLPNGYKGGGKVTSGRFLSTSYGPPWGGIQGGGVTATGINLKGSPQRHLVAVDPSVIPLHSKVSIWPNPFNYRGKFAAEDTGGAIKGRRIDFYDWRGRGKQNGWGKRNVQVGTRTTTSKDGSRVREANAGTIRTTRMYPKVPIRGSLMEAGAAARSGYDMALAGDTFKSRKKYGDPFLTDLRSAYGEAVNSRTQTDKADGVSVKSATAKLPDGVGAGTRLGRMIQTANAIDSKRYQYAWGGGHGKIGVPGVGSLHAHGRGPKGLGFDCSGAVSAVLGAGKMLSRPLTSGALMGWGAKGGSKNLGVYTDPGHVIMRIRNRFFGTGGENPRGGAGWLKGNTMSGRGVTRHWPGFRRGGTVGSFRTGGTAGRRSAPASALTPRLRSRILSQGFAKLDDTIGRLASARLNALYAEVAKLAAKGGDPTTVNRLRAAMDLIDRKLGYRIGRYALAAQKIQTGMDARTRTSDLAFRAAGADPASQRGLAIQGSQNLLDQADIASQRQQVTKGIALARKMGPRGKDMLTELRSRLDELREAAGEAAVRQVELARESVAAASADRAKRADWAQRLAGVDSSSAGGIAVQKALAYQDQKMQDASVAALQSQIAAAKKGGKAGAKKLPYLEAALADARDAVTESIVRQVELAREAVVAAASDRSDAAQRATDAVNAGLAMNEAVQRVNRTTDTAGGMAQRAAMQAALAPALQAQAEVERQNAGALAAIGKNTEAQDALARAAQLSTDALNAVADSAELARAAQMKAVTDRIDATNFDASIADVIGERYQLQQRLAGAADPTLATARADYFRSTVLPLLQRQESDLAAAVATAAGQQDTEAERAYMLELEQKRNEILERSLQVQEDIKSNTANRTFGGSLAYEFGGGVYTDLVLDGNGA